MKTVLRYFSLATGFLCFGAVIFLYLSGFVQAFLGPGGELVDRLVFVLLVVGGFVSVAIGLAIRD